MRNVCYALLSILALVWDGGCADRVTAEVGRLNDSNIKRVVNLYAGYQFLNGWQGPRDQQALVDFVKQGRLPAKNFRMMGIDPDKLDSIFISERDGKPFKVKYGVGGGIGVVTPIVFEQVGIGSKREVGFTTPIVEEVDDTRYNELWEKGGLPLAKGPDRLRQGGPGQDTLFPSNSKR
jgi:hypothetical protein